MGSLVARANFIRENGFALMDTDYIPVKDGYSFSTVAWRANVCHGRNLVQTADNNDLVVLIKKPVNIAFFMFL